MFADLQASSLADIEYEPFRPPWVAEMLGILVFSLLPTFQHFPPPLCFIIRSVTSTGTNFYSVFLSKFNAGSKYFSQFWKTVDTLERKFKWQLGWCVLRSCVQKVTPLTCLFHLLTCRQSALIVTYVPGTREHCSLHCNFLDNLLFLWIQCYISKSFLTQQQI